MRNSGCFYLLFEVQVVCSDLGEQFQTNVFRNFAEDFGDCQLVVLVQNKFHCLCVQVVFRKGCRFAGSGVWGDHAWVVFRGRGELLDEIVLILLIIILDKQSIHVTHAVHHCFMRVLQIAHDVFATLCILNVVFKLLTFKEKLIIGVPAYLPILEIRARNQFVFPLFVFIMLQF